MNHQFQSHTLGKTGLTVSRLGLAASYGAPVEAFEEAFERGCSYFYMGGGRKRATMKQAIRNLCARGQRDKLVISLQTYARHGLLTPFLFKKTLNAMNLEYADILILGWHNKRPPNALFNMAHKLKEKGLAKFIGMSGHNRRLFPELVAENKLDVCQIRYNAAHRGAETEIFPQLPVDQNRPGIVSYTATRWGHLLQAKKMPPGEPPLTATDCYRFVMSNENVDICLCGPRDVDQMRTAIKALDMGPLSADEIDRVKRVGDHVHQKGGGFF